MVLIICCFGLLLLRFSVNFQQVLPLVYTIFLLCCVTTTIHTLATIDSKKEDLNESFKAYRVHFLTLMQVVHTRYNMEIDQLSFKQFAISESDQNKNICC